MARHRRTSTSHMHTTTHTHIWGHRILNGEALASGTRTESEPHKAMWFGKQYCLMHHIRIVLSVFFIGNQVWFSYSFSTYHAFFFCVIHQQHTHKNILSFCSVLKRKKKTTIITILKWFAIKNYSSIACNTYAFNLTVALNRDWLVIACHVICLPIFAADIYDADRRTERQNLWQLNYKRQ